MLGSGGAASSGQPSEEVCAKQGDFSTEPLACLTRARARNIVSNMKTTIDVADSLLEEARQIAARDHTTLRELVQEGLRRVIDDRRPDRKPFRLRSIKPGGGGFQPEFADGDWQRIRDEIYQGRGT